MQRGYVDTPQGQLHYYEHGRGQPLLLLHQSPRSARTFDRMMRALGGKFRCIAVDTFGFGHSDPVPDKATMRDLGRSMVDVLDGLDIESAHVLGFHTGNKIAAAMAADHPDRVGKLVLIGMTHSLVTSKKDRDAAILGIVGKYMTSYGESNDGAHLLRAWATDYGSLASIWWNPDVMAARKVTPAMLAQLELQMLEMIQARHSIKQVYGMNFAFDLVAAARKIKAPSLVIECCTPAEAHLGAQGPRLVKYLKRGTLVTLQDVGFEATETHALPIAKIASRFLLDA